MTHYLFPEERDLRAKLVTEWQQEVLYLLELSKNTFEERSKSRDTNSALWNRTPFPMGIVTLIEEKLGRAVSVLERPTEPAGHKPAINELIDIAMYCLFLAAIAQMLDRRAK